MILNVVVHPLYKAFFNPNVNQVMIQLSDLGRLTLSRYNFSHLVEASGGERVDHTFGRHDVNDGNVNPG